MANANPGDPAVLRWLPSYSYDEQTETLSVWCHNNTQAIAACDVAAERGLTARRFRARADAPAPILITIRDERMPVIELSPLAVFGMWQAGRS